MMKLIAAMTSAIAMMGVSLAADSNFPDIGIKDLKKAIDSEKVVVIDVNGSASYKKSHIPTAIDYQSKRNELAKHLPHDKGTLVVAYCGGPSCGAYKAAAKQAKKLGYTNVKHLSAGISGWLQAEMPTEKGDQKSEKS